jgi:4-hydroxybenzoate polyprenyltransferase
MKDFFLHLRLNYNVLILSAPFLIGAIYAGGISDIKIFLFNFFVIFIIFFGSINAYNSYYDKDDGPIGGLKRPPKMKKWMLFAAWFMKLLAIVLSFYMGIVYTVTIILGAIMSWLYSGPPFRLKSHPIISLILVGVGSISFSVIWGFLSAGGQEFSLFVILGIIANGLVFLSMYPFSQIYQIEEDKRRGDNTFCVRFGVSGVKKFFYIFYLIGAILLVYSLLFNVLITSIIAIVSIITYVGFIKILKNIKGESSEYKKVMKTKYYGGISYTLLVVILLFLI